MWIWTFKEQHVYYLVFPLLILIFSKDFPIPFHTIHLYKFCESIFFSMCVAQSLSLSLYVSVIFLHFFSSYSAILFCGYNGAWKRCTKTVLFVNRHTKDFAVCVMCINITFILLFAFSFIFFSNFSSFWIKIDGTFNTGAY